MVVIVWHGCISESMGERRVWIHQFRVSGEYRMVIDKNSFRVLNSWGSCKKLKIAQNRGHMQSCPNIMKSDDLTLGVRKFLGPGRFQKITERNFQSFLDGAHNESNVQHAV